MTTIAPEGFDPFWMRHALGRPETCTEGVDKRGVFDTCDKVAVALRLDPEEQEPYPVCARHARADMVPLEAIVRFMLNRERQRWEWRSLPPEGESATEALNKQLGLPRRVND